MLEHHIATRDGRTLLVLEVGDPAGRPVLAHGGTPNSRLLIRPYAARAGERGIRLISYDRPGYGGSTPQPGRTVADCAQDVRAIAKGLDTPRLPVWGFSGGGPHAIASAALLPDLVPAVAVLASCAPWNAEGLDYFAGMGEMNVDGLRLELEDPVAARAKLEADRQDVLALTPAALLEFMSTLLSPADASVIDGEWARYRIEGWRSGLAPGLEGWWEDEMAMLAPWGFALGSIRTPTLLLHGRQDRFVPCAHGEWLSRCIPGVEAELTDDGHISLMARHLDHVHDWLLERLEPRSG